MKTLNDWFQVLCVGGCVIPLMLAIIVVGIDSAIRIVFPRKGGRGKF